MTNHTALSRKSDYMHNADTGLQRLLRLSLAGRNHPAYTLYTGIPAFDHEAVLSALSADRTAAKRAHQACVALGVISPPVGTSRDRAAIRVQFIYADRIADVLNGGQDDE